MTQEIQTIEKQREEISLALPERTLFLLKVQRIIKRKTGGYIPRGRRNQVDMCPLSIAFDRDIVFGYRIPGLTFEEKMLMMRFRGRFDNKEFPELEVDKESFKELKRKYGSDENVRKHLKSEAMQILSYETVIGEKTP